MRWYITLLLVFTTLHTLIDGKQFRLGRGKGGNLGVPGDTEDHNLPPAQWFIQNVDHSSYSDTRTWKQRFFVNDTFFVPETGPVFLMIGGEGPVDPRWMINGEWIEYAKKFNALCINVEHRYYGESHPTNDLTVKNLQYLSSYQALADLANFISQMSVKLKLRKDIKWIAFGGSYPGSLAAWLRLKYPHLVYGVVSSSGPLLAKVDFKEYFEGVAHALVEKTGGNECVEVVKEAHSQIVKLIEENPEVIEKEFKVCRPFADATEDDMKNFYNGIADDFAELVQYNEDNRISMDNTYKNVTINSVCKILTETDGSPAYKRLAAFNTIMLHKSNQTCMDYSYDNMIAELRNTTWGLDAARQWMYQTCTEFGFYQTSTNEASIFGNMFPVDFFVQQCQDVFGKKYNYDFIAAGTKWTNNNYGALDISVDRVMYVHGSIDPWHALGILEPKTYNRLAIFIQGTAHCANMYPPSDNDSAELREARRFIEKNLRLWVGRIE